MTPPWVELEIASNFSFLRGASHPAELAACAATLGYCAMAITDRATLSGIVLAHTHLRNNPSFGTRLVVGCRLDLTDKFSLLCYPTNRQAYGRLTRLLTRGRTHAHADKGECNLGFTDVLEFAEGQRFIFPCPDDPERSRAAIERCADEFGPNFYLALTDRSEGGDKRKLDDLSAYSKLRGIRTVVTNDILYHEPGRKSLRDVLTCIREGCTIEEAGFLLDGNAERYLRHPKAIYRLYAKWPAALDSALQIADECRFCLDELCYQYPFELAEPGITAFEDLKRRTWKGAHFRYPKGIPEEVARQVDHELRLIEKRNYAPYFLTVHDIVLFAQKEGILYQGRGSAANSLVCYCLEITQADPVKQNLLFERFISASRNEPPDIDVDFEHERREEVIQHIYSKYGRNRAGIAATVVHYRTRRAVREVSKVFGLSEDTIRSLTGSVWGWSTKGVDEQSVQEAGLNPADKRLRMVLELARELIGFPRHLSQHVGGFVLSQSDLTEFVPIENAAMKDRTIVQWDKNDLDELGMMKVDILALGMLTAIRKSFEFLMRHYGIDYKLSTVPPQDEKVFEMLQNADSIGVFQVESRAQQSMLPRLRPREFYDLVIEVAIVRPGPIQGNMVHPYLRRRELKEAVTYPSEELKKILEKTLGVPLFQEQAMQIAITGANFTPNEADDLRRSLATFRHNGKITTFRKRFIDGMVANKYPIDFAERCFSQIEGFGTYGFPEAHAISFANLVYVSAYIKCYFPDVFCAALLNSQPMGFYSPPQLINDARNHGVEVRPVDVNHSDWDCTLERSTAQGSVQYAVRLGLRMVKGLQAKCAEEIVKHRAQGYRSPTELAMRAGCNRESLETLAYADTFRSMELSRRKSLWSVSALDSKIPPLFETLRKIYFAKETRRCRNHLQLRKYWKIVWQRACLCADIR